MSIINLAIINGMDETANALRALPPPPCGRDLPPSEEAPRVPQRLFSKEEMSGLPVEAIGSWIAPEYGDDADIFAKKREIFSLFMQSQNIRALSFKPAEIERRQTWFVENFAHRPSYRGFFNPLRTDVLGAPPFPDPEMLREESDMTDALEGIEDVGTKTQLRDVLLALKDDRQTDTLAISFLDGETLKTKVWSWTRPLAD